jgi:hypothetical protein
VTQQDEESAWILAELMDVPPGADGLPVATAISILGCTSSLSPGSPPAM